MTRDEFVSILDSCGITRERVCFDELHGRDDVYFIRNNYGTWEVCFFELGNEENLKKYTNESDALLDLLHRLRVKL